MRYKNTLLTGHSGTLGQAILASGAFSGLLSPSRDSLDITKPETIRQFFKGHDIDAVIHCAALARMAECESEPRKAIQANMSGTCNLVMESMIKEKELGESIRFVYISTDGVYPGIRGNYTEHDETIPYNKYGWTKLGAEGAVNLLDNFCIIRTSFFDPNNIPFDASATDAYSSKVTTTYLVKAIGTMLNSDFIGTINIGGSKKSDYDRYKEFKPQLKPCKLDDIMIDLPFKLANNASLNSSLWEQIEKKERGSR